MDKELLFGRRKQTVEIINLSGNQQQKYKWTAGLMENGVPQGSVLGLLLYPGRYQWSSWEQVAILRVTLCSQMTLILLITGKNQTELENLSIETIKEQRKLYFIHLSYNKLACTKIDKLHNRTDNSRSWQQSSLLKPITTLCKTQHTGAAYHDCWENP